MNKRGVSNKPPQGQKGAEFGHIAQRFADGFADSWGVGPFVILAANGKEYRFEDSDQFGPSLIKKNGELLKRPWPDEQDQFWDAYQCWRWQGRRVEEDNITCVYDERD